VGILSSHFQITWFSPPSGQAFEAYVASVSHPVSGRKPCPQVKKEFVRSGEGTARTDHKRGQ
jgi:hypothetical protein